MTDVRIDYDVPVPMSDGTVLRADVYRPGDKAGHGPWPVLVHRTPYDKRNLGGPPMLDTFAAVRGGYIVVHQDTRGRLASEGEWSPWEFERQDGLDTVEWAAALPGSNGAVGMFGGSYTGSTQWSAAIAGAPALKAIAPGQTWSDPLDGLFQRGGALELGLNAFWTLLTAAAHLPRMHSGEELMGAFDSFLSDYDGLSERGYWELPSGRLPLIDRYGGPDIGTQRALQNPDTAAYNRVHGHHADLDVPAFNIAGWYDVFLQGTLDNYSTMAAQGVPAKLLVGPWKHGPTSEMAPGHVGEVNFGMASSFQLLGGTGPLTDLQLRWFDHWLKDTDTGLLGQAPVKIFVMGANIWRDEDEWPLSRAVDTAWHLRSDGRLDTAAPTADEDHDTYVYDPADPVITCGGPLVMPGEFPPGPFDQAITEQRPDVLVYTSEPMTTDLEVTGRIRMTLFASTDAPSTDWVVRLCDVDEHGVSRNLTDGILRVQGEPGATGEYHIDLWSTSNVFLTGHRIRVHVTSSNFPRWDRNPNTGKPAQEATTFQKANQQIFHDAARPSHIVLPVVPPQP
jgi:putative CocE/NonD family hydrolase